MSLNSKLVLRDLVLCASEWALKNANFTMLFLCLQWPQMNCKEKANTLNLVYTEGWTKVPTTSPTLMGTAPLLIIVRPRLHWCSSLSVHAPCCLRTWITFYVPFPSPEGQFSPLTSAYSHGRFSDTFQNSISLQGNLLACPGPGQDLKIHFYGILHFCSIIV